MTTRSEDTLKKYEKPWRFWSSGVLRSIDCKLFTQKSLSLHQYPCENLYSQPQWRQASVNLTMAPAKYGVGKLTAYRDAYTDPTEWFATVFTKSRSFVTFSPVRSLAELAGGPTLYMSCQGEGISTVPSANPISLSLCKRLAPNLALEILIGQKLGNELWMWLCQTPPHEED